MSVGATDDAINAAREAFHRHLAATQKGQQHVQDTSEEDLTQVDERELDAEFAGEFLYTIFFSPRLLYAFVLKALVSFVIIALTPLIVVVLFPGYLCLDIYAMHGCIFAKCLS